MLKKFYVLSDQAVLICEVKPLSKSKKMHFFWTFSNSGWLSGGYDVPGANVFYATSIKQCQEICNNKRECCWFNHDMRPDKNECHLKATSGDRIEIDPNFRFGSRNEPYSLITALSNDWYEDWKTDIVARGLAPKRNGYFKDPTYVMGSFSFTYSSKPEVSCEELCNGNRDCRWFVFRKDTIECSLLQLEGKNFQDDPNFVLGWRTEPPPKMTVVTKRPETVLCQATDGVFLGGGGGGAVCKHYMIDDDVFFR